MIFEGNLVATSGKYAIVVARFNEFITSKLLGAAKDGLERHGVKSEDIDTAWVPGAFEIPFLVSSNKSKFSKLLKKCLSLECSTELFPPIPLYVVTLFVV